VRVLVTDGANRAALAITRSLGRAGHEVLVGEKHAPSLAQTSRYCSTRFVYPDPLHASEAFVETLARIVQERRVDAVLPVADITTFLVTGNRERFEPGCAVPFAPAAVVERAADKVDIVRTAMRLGVPVPHSIVVESPASAPPAAELTVTLVIKPWRSRIRTADGWHSTEVSFAGDAAELARDLARRPAHEFPVMLQERIVGPGVGVFACYHQGKPIALMSHRRIRERPPWGGVSVLSESVPLCPMARESALKLLDELHWHGVAMVEFKRDARDGVPKLMEINGRFWGSLQLAIDAGVDFPALLIEGVTRTSFGPPAEYRVGVRNRWWWGDVDSLLLTLRRRRPAGVAPAANRLAELRRFAHFWGRNLYYENPKWYDLKPFLFETYRWLRSP
jgi:predicted ATP-grasp superfamily ATP-dependent carboligase